MTLIEDLLRAALVGEQPKPRSHMKVRLSEQPTVWRASTPIDGNSEANGLAVLELSKATEKTEDGCNMTVAHYVERNGERKLIESEEVLRRDWSVEVADAFARCHMAIDNMFRYIKLSDD